MSTADANKCMALAYAVNGAFWKLQLPYVLGYDLTAVAVKAGERSLITSCCATLGLDGV
jgi:hypothetical protein